MDAEAFRATLADFGLTQGAFARFLDIDERTVRRWATGGPPRAIALLLGLMQRFKVGPGDM